MNCVDDVKKELEYMEEIKESSGFDFENRNYAKWVDNKKSKIMQNKGVKK